MNSDSPLEMYVLLFLTYKRKYPNYLTNRTQWKWKGLLKIVIEFLHLYIDLYFNEANTLQLFYQDNQPHFHRLYYFDSWDGYKIFALFTFNLINFKNYGFSDQKLFRNNCNGHKSRWSNALLHRAHPLSRSRSGLDNWLKQTISWKTRTTNHLDFYMYLPCWQFLA